MLFYEFYLLSTHCQRITWAGGLTRTPAASSENQHRCSFLLFAFICFAKSSFFGWLSSHWVRMLGRGLVGGVQFPELPGAVAVWCRVFVRCRLLCGFAWRQSDCPKVSPWCTIATVCRGQRMTNGRRRDQGLRSWESEPWKSPKDPARSATTHAYPCPLAGQAWRNSRRNAKCATCSPREHQSVIRLSEKNETRRKTLCLGWKHEPVGCWLGLFLGRSNGGRQLDWCSWCQKCKSFYNMIKWTSDFSKNYFEKKNILGLFFRISAKTEVSFLISGYL